MSSDTPDHVEDAETSDSLILLAQAFDLAWAQFIAAEGASADTDHNRRRLANQLVALSRAGETDTEALAQAALLHLHAFAAAMRISEQDKAFTHPEPGASFAPDTVDAMTRALELCLEDLPLRVPSSVREAISTEIMRRAAQGERAPEKLRDAALAALENRR